MLRLYDWECCTCGDKHDGLVNVPQGNSPPKIAAVFCRICNDEMRSERRLSLPAPYMGEKTLNPRVWGGKHDTMGAQKLPDLPMLPGSEDCDRQASAAIAALPDNASQADYKAALRDVPAPSAADYSTMFNTPEYKAVESERAEISKRNAQKTARRKAIDSGANINMKVDRCVGDPNLAS